MFHPTSQSSEMLRRILVESSIKQHDAQDAQPVENVDSQIEEASSAGRISIRGRSVITDAMLSRAAAPAVHHVGFRAHDMILAGSSALGADSDSEVPHELALAPHDLEEDVNDDAGVMLGLNIDHDSSSNLFTY